MRTLWVFALLISATAAFAESGVPTAPSQVPDSIRAHVHDLLFVEPGRALERAREKDALEREAIRAARDFIRVLCASGSVFATLDLCAQVADDHHLHEKEKMLHDQAEKEHEELAASVLNAQQKTPPDPPDRTVVVERRPSYLTQMNPAHCRLDFARMKDEILPPL